MQENKNTNNDCSCSSLTPKKRQTNKPNPRCRICRMVSQGLTEFCSVFKTNIDENVSYEESKLFVEIKYFYIADQSNVKYLKILFQPKLKYVNSFFNYSINNFHAHFISIFCTYVYSIKVL